MNRIIIPFFSPISEKTLHEHLRAVLQKGGWKTSEPSEILAKPDLRNSQVWIFVGTGGTENAIIDFIEGMKLQKPPILVSYDQNNSLPAAMEIRRFLEHSEIPTKIIHATLLNLTKTLDNEEYFLTVKEKLHSYRLGMIGKQSDWLIASSINRQEVKKTWGIDIIDIPISELTGKVQQGDIAIESIEDSIFLQEALETDRTDEEFNAAQIVVNSLKEIIRDYDLNALSIECFSLLSQTESTACYALSHLNDKGTVAGCEGDLPSTFTMMIVKLLIGQASFMANVASVDQEQNSAILAHCTIPLEMIDKYSITSHYESDKGVAIRGEFKTEQKVTIVKIGGEKLDKYWISTGIITKNPENEHCCRTQVKIQLDDSVDYFLKNSLANHHIMVLGNHKDTFEAFLADKCEKVSY